jgi:hypothetical protein
VLSPSTRRQISSLCRVQRASSASRPRRGCRTCEPKRPATASLSAPVTCTTVVMATRSTPDRCGTIMPTSRPFDWSSSAGPWSIWSMGNRRRYERFSCWGTGELIVRDRAGRPERRKAIIRSVSKRGLGAHLLGDAAERLSTGVQVVVRLPGFGGLLELPGKIVWSERSREPPALCCIGIVLFVDIVPASTRRLFASWLSDAITRHHVPPVSMEPRAPDESMASPSRRPAGPGPIR